MTTGGTDTHLITADPAPLGVDGRTARGRLLAAGLVLDCCVLPHGDGRGLRLGTAAVTTRGWGSRRWCGSRPYGGRAARGDGAGRGTGGGARAHRPVSAVSRLSRGSRRGCTATRATIVATRQSSSICIRR
ncbi:hypothetical protein LT493_20000 [Streptomyces tricolor]|nr:hypothetical protein [Streptomyces tricolor]